MKHFLLGFFLLSTSFFAYGKDILVKDLNQGYFTWSSDEVLVTRTLKPSEHSKLLFSNGACEVYIPTISGSSKRSMEKGSYAIVKKQYDFINSNHIVLIHFNAWSKAFSKEGVRRAISYIACIIPNSKYPKSLKLSELNKELQGSGIVIVAD